MKELPLNPVLDTLVEVEVTEKADTNLDAKFQKYPNFKGVTSRDGKNYVLLDKTDATIPDEVTAIEVKEVKADAT